MKRGRRAGEWSVAAALIAAAGGALAQGVPSTDEAPPPAPTMLPGDRAPASLARMLRPPRPNPPPAPPPDATPAPSTAVAIDAARAAIARCARDGIRLGVAVVDAAGQLRLALSAPGAQPELVFVAARKAAAAAAFGVPTSVVQDRLRRDPAALAILRPYMIVSPGAVPLTAHGRLLGTIGGSGGTGQQDEACVAAGAARVGHLLDKDAG